MDSYQLPELILNLATVFGIIIAILLYVVGIYLTSSAIYIEVIESDFSKPKIRNVIAIILSIVGGLLCFIVIPLFLLYLGLFYRD